MSLRLPHGVSQPFLVQDSVRSPRALHLLQAMLAACPLSKVFPGTTEQGPILKIVSLAPQFSHIRGQLDNLGPGPPLLPELPRRFSHFVTLQHPVAHFQQTGLDLRAEDKQDRYIERVSKRPRL